MEGQKPRILYADENPNNCEFIVRDLVDYEVSCAATAEETLRQAKSGSFDLILLNEHLFGATGIEICRQLRKHDNQTPILILSGPDEAVIRSQALEAGAQDYWPKPVDLEAVGREIAGLLEVKRAAATAEAGRAPQSASEPIRESGLPGGGRGRKDFVGHTNVYPVSAAEGASPDAQIHAEMSWGQGTRGAAGYDDHGDSEITNLERLQKELSETAEKKPKRKAARHK